MAGLITDSVRRNGGRFVYALDDPYIHMAIAKNFAVHGVWGVTAEGFTSSTSAPLWTLLLAIIYRLFGVSDLTPLIFNILAALALLTLAYCIFARFTQRSWLIFLLLVAALYATPLPAQTLAGMEHLLHAVVSIGFSFVAAQVIAKPRPLTFKRWLPLLILAPILSAVRYEGLFLIGAAGLLLLVQRKFAPAAGIGLTGLLPPVVYGWISATQGWMFLPNSLMLKSAAIYSPPGERFSLVFDKLVERAGQNSAVITLVLLSLILWMTISKRPGTHLAQTLNTLFALTCIIHLVFADLGWFYRYEAYLMPLGLIAVGVSLTGLLPAGKINIRWDSGATYAGALLGLTLLLVFWARSSHSLRDAATATANIHEQQIQMAKFAERYYSGRAVAANDIGALSYYADAQLLDLFGLGSLEPAQLKLQGRYDTLQIARLVREKDVQVVMVYDTWFEEFGGLPAHWIKVGEWEIQNNVVCGHRVVSFYAPTEAALPYLQESLSEFAAQLSQDVKFWFSD
ncbi:MAG: hypothetical protein JW987_02950 [Anaerolineaceae bacterium]|nr:hypothetical protein [Anaerolineaceae bacterium]